MAENRTIEEQVIELIKMYPNKKASELYQIAPFHTDYSYFNHKYNEYKNRNIPKTKDGLYEQYPTVVKWVLDNYETTNLTIPEIGELLEISPRIVRLIKKTFHLVKQDTRSRSTYDYAPQIPEKHSLGLEVGDIILVTKYSGVELRDIVYLGKWEVIHKHKHCISFRDPGGWVHGFPPILLHKYIEYEEVSN
jgi:hypothetical protein